MTFDQLAPDLPPGLKYTVYPSVAVAGKASLWDANARYARSNEFIAGASGDTPTAALNALADVLAGDLNKIASAFT